MTTDAPAFCQCGHTLDDHALYTCDVDDCDCNGPYVCPDCHAVGAEPCAPWCPDEERRRECAEQDDADLFDVDEWCDVSDG